MSLVLARMKSLASCSGVKPLEFSASTVRTARAYSGSVFPGRLLVADLFPSLLTSRITTHVPAHLSLSPANVPHESSGRSIEERDRVDPRL